MVLVNRLNQLKMEMIHIMSDIAKWGLLITGFLIMIGIVVAFPINSYMDVAVFGNAITSVVNLAGNALIFGRGLVNNLLSSWARSALSGLMIWLVAKWLMTYTLKVLVWVYHFIFK